CPVGLRRPTRGAPIGAIGPGYASHGSVGRRGRGDWPRRRNGAAPSVQPRGLSVGEAGLSDLGVTDEGAIGEDTRDGGGEGFGALGSGKLAGAALGFRFAVTNEEVACRHRIGRGARVFHRKGIVGRGAVYASAVVAGGGIEFNAVGREDRAVIIDAGAN